MTTLQEDKLLDCSGMLCPVPVIKTSKAIKEMQVGQVLKMVSTDPGAPPDMVAWARKTGNKLRASNKEGKHYFFFSRKLKYPIAYRKSPPNSPAISDCRMR